MPPNKLPPLYLRDAKVLSPENGTRLFYITMETKYGEFIFG